MESLSIFHKKPPPDGGGDKIRGYFRSKPRINRFSGTYSTTDINRVMMVFGSM